MGIDERAFGRACLEAHKLSLENCPGYGTEVKAWLKPVIEVYENARAATGQPVECREAFEQWSLKMGKPFESTVKARERWLAWQAAWAERQPEREAVSQWQPIETAPTDGTTILGYIPLLGICSIANVDSAWVDSCHSQLIYRRPISHWMPLPQPPEQSRRG